MYRKHTYTYIQMCKLAYDQTTNKEPVEATTVRKWQILNSAEGQAKTVKQICMYFDI